MNEQIHDNDIDSVKIECSESSKKYKYYVYIIYRLRQFTYERHQHGLKYVECIVE